MKALSNEKIIGKFVYQADVVQPRRRKPERINLVALCEYEIPSIGAKDIVAGALQVRTCKDSPTITPVRYDGWAGRLWAPLQPGGPDRRRDREFIVTIDEYKRSFADFPFLAQPLPIEEPVAQCFDRSVGPSMEIWGWRPARDYTRSEDDLRGEVLWSNRSEALRNHTAAASERLLIVDGLLYVRRSEPVWAVLNSSWRDVGDEVHLMIPGRLINSEGKVFSHWRELNCTALGYDEFRLDRLDHALRWHRHVRAGREAEVRGAVLEIDTNFLVRDDSAHAIANKLPDALRSLVPALADLSPSAVHDWNTLYGIVGSASLDDVSMIEPGAVRPILGRLSASLIGVPRQQIERCRKFVEASSELMRRLDFEPSPRPLGMIEDEAIARLSLAGT